MITSAKINSIQEKIKLAISKIEQEENVSIKFDTCRYNSLNYYTKMTVTTNSKTESSTKSVMTQQCKKVGFTQNVIGMTFINSNGNNEIVEIKTRSPKFPVISRCNGKLYKSSVERVKSLLGGDKLINRAANLDLLVNN